jgi:hypothetical protein
MAPQDQIATPASAADAPVVRDDAIKAAVDPSARTFWIATIAMAVVLAAAPWVGVYPVFVMKALCFALFACAFNLLIGYAGPALVRPRDVLRHGRLRVRARGEGLGLSARICDSSPAAIGGDGARRRHRRAGDPPPGHLLRDDHARDGADDLLLLPADAVHARRGRHPVGARAAACSACST